MRTPRAVLLPLGALVLAVALAGCGDDPAEVADPTPTATDASPDAGVAAGLQVRQVAFQGQVAPDDADPSLAGKLADLQCAPGAEPPGNQDPARAMVACDVRGVKYGLDPAAVVGGVAGAEAAQPQGQDGWSVNVALDAEAGRQLQALAEQVVGSEAQIAFVVDGQVVSAPTVAGVISTEIQLSGDLSEAQARDLAARLRP